MHRWQLLFKTDSGVEQQLFEGAVHLSTAEGVEELLQVGFCG